ncbi:MAG: serine hydrolase domain-containing protein [Propionibacteriaceae bacterium]
MQPMPPGLLTSDSWRERLSTLAARHHVPGVEVGLIALGDGDSTDLRVVTTGVTSLSTGVEVTPETLFQFGSITKVFTTTLIMQLVDEGVLDLDTLVVDVLDDFALADPAAAAEVTVRHLLTHTSGIDGDVFTHTGDGDDCLARYVRELTTAVSITKPGGHLSYCNAGFVVAGRIVEVLRDQAWDDALAEHLLAPLGLRHIITRAKDAPLFRTAVGHLKTSADEAEVRPTTTWMLPRSMGPAGLQSGSVSDLLSFAAAHLRNGLGLNGTRVLSNEAAEAMRVLQVDLSADTTTQPGWGLGWSLVDWGGETAVSHGGGTIGQICDLHVFPERQLAIAVLTNSSTGSALIHELLELLGAELGLTPPTPRRDPDADDVDLRPLIGRYESTASLWEIRPTTDGRLELAMSSKLDLDDEPDPAPQLIVPAGPRRFLINQDGIDREVAYVSADGRNYLYAVRLLERTSG